MLYFYVFIIAFLGVLSGNFRKLGEVNIGRAGGADNIIIPQLFGPALLIALISGISPYVAIAFVGFSIGWLEALYAFGVTIIGAFVCGFLPFNIRHVVVFFSPLLIGWCFYQLWIY